MSRETDGLGERLHAALVDVRDGRATGDDHRAILDAVRAIGGGLLPDDEPLDADQVDEVFVDVTGSLVTRRQYDGERGPHAVEFVARVVSWRLVELLQRRAPTAPRNADSTETLHGAAWSFERLRRSLLLLAGETRERPHVRDFLDARFGHADPNPPTDRPKQGRLARHRAVGRRHARALVERYAAAFAEDAAPNVDALLGEATPQGGAREG